MAKSSVINVLINGDTKGLKSALGESESAIKDFGVKAGKALAAVGAAVVAAGAAVAVKGVKDFIEYENRLAEVFTLLPNLSQTAMDDMSAQVKAFSREFGVLPNELIPALYQAISAGVPANNVFSFLETAQMAAKGGVTDLQTAVDGITSVVNAYGSDILSAAQASDMMFTAIKLGKTDFTQLSKSLFNVTPIASALGVNFADVTAALAAMTAQGVPTSVATTQLRQLFVELSKSGTLASGTFQEMSGKTFSDFVKSGGSVYEALDIMKRAADENGMALQDLFGSVEAGSAALTLQGSGAFIAAIDEMGSSAGATQVAFERMNSTLRSKLDKIRARLSVAFINIGEALAPVVEKIADRLIPLLERLTPVIQGMSAAFEKDGFGGVLRYLNDTVLPKVREKLAEVGQALVDWIAPRIGPALEKLGEWLRRLGAWVIDDALPWLGQKLAQLGQALVDWIKPRFVPAMQALGDLIGRLANWIVDVGVPTFGEKIRPLGQKLTDWIEPRIEPAMQELGKFFGRLAKWIATEGMPKLAKEFAKNAGSMLVWIAQLLPHAIVGMYKFTWELAKQLPSIFAGLGVSMYRVGTTLGTLWVEALVTALKGFAGRSFDIGRPFVNALISFVNRNVIAKINDLLDLSLSFGGVTVRINPPDIKGIPMLADGGIVTRPTLAVIGEAGPEAVVPLSGRNAGAMGSTSAMVVNITTGADPNAVVEAIERYRRRNGSLPFAVS